MREYDNKIVAVRYTRGKISHVKLDCGEILTLDQAVGAAHSNALSGVSLGSNNKGEWTIRAKRDGSSENNLSDLPRF